MGQPTTNQAGFRGRYDDGSETGASWIANLDTNWSQAVDTVFRVRFLLTNTGDKVENDGYRLYYSHQGGTYTRVTTTSSVIKSVASAEDGWTITDDENTTQQIGVGANFSEGKYDETGETGIFILGIEYETELEWCLSIVSGDVEDAQSIELRVYFDDDSQLDNYLTNKTPNITVSEVSDPQISESETLTISDSPAAKIDLAHGASESLGISDSPTAALTNLLVAVSDSCGISDSPVTDIQSLIVVSDSVGLSDSLTGVEIGDLALSVSDGLTISDAVSAELGNLVLSVSESLDLSDSVGLVIALGVPASDTLTLSDSASASLADLALSVSDSLGLSDSASLEIGYDPCLFSVSDGLTVSDAITVALGALALSVSDSLGISDSPAVDVGAEPPRTVSVFDGLTITDEVRKYTELIVMMDTVRDIILVSDVRESESLGISDSATVVLSTLTLSVSDGLTLSDTPAQSIDLTISALDSLTISDTVTVQVSVPGAIGASVSDSLTISDSPTLEFTALTISISDSLTIADDVTVQAGVPSSVFVTASDTLGLSDSASLALGNLLVAVSDNLSISDSAVVQPVSPGVVAISVTDTLGLSDSVSLALGNLLVSALDTLGLSDSASLAIPIAVATSDGLGLSDTVSVLIACRVSVSETLIVTDSASLRLSTMTISVTETITLADSVNVRVIEFGLVEITVSDSLTVQDGPAMLLDLNTQISDSLTLTDSVSGSMPYIGELVSFILFVTLTRFWNLKVDRSPDWDMYVTRSRNFKVEL